MSDEPLPRILCDQCMKPATVERIDGMGGELFRLSCHDRQEIIDRWAVAGHYPGKLADHSRRAEHVLLWSNIAIDFKPDVELRRREQQAVDGVLARLNEILALGETQRSHGVEQLKLDIALIDRLIDSLLLYRPE